jgi:hypothetical protein
MKVFIGWSGQRSMKIGQILYDWLPVVHQNVKPFISTEEIKKGTRWASSVANELQSCKFGLICLTPDNLAEPWIYFEAGALAKVVEQSHVAPVLFRLKPSDIQGPLTQFQAVALTDQKDMMRLLKSINQASGEEAREERYLEQAFNGLWGQLEAQINSLPETELEKEMPVPSISSMQPIMEEILVLVRQQSQTPIIENSMHKQWNRVLNAARIETAGDFDEMAEKWTGVLHTWKALSASVRTKESNPAGVQAMHDVILEFANAFDRALVGVRRALFPSAGTLAAAFTDAGTFSAFGALAPGAGLAGLGSPRALLEEGSPGVGLRTTLAPPVEGSIAPEDRPKPKE